MNIVLATDFSEDAKTALHLLEKLRLVASSNVTLLHVIGRPSDFSRAARDRAAIRKFVDRIRQEADKKLALDAEWLQARRAQVTPVVREGDTADEIRAAAAESKADLVVLGARGLSRLQRFFLGSVSQKVARHAPCSVLVVRGPNEITHETRNVAPTQSICPTLVVGYDGSPNSNDAVETVARWPLASKAAPLVLVTTFAHETMFTDALRLEQVSHEERIAAKEVFGRGVSKLENAGYRVIPEFGGGNPADEIIRTAEANDADVVVIGSTGRSGIERLLLGSVADHVLRHAPCSVWLQRQRVLTLKPHGFQTPVKAT